MSTSFKPQWGVHPGGTLREFLEERGMTQTALAEQSGWTLKHINQVIQGHVAISADFALMLEEELGNEEARPSAEFWYTLQANYDLAVARGYPVSNP